MDAKVTWKGGLAFDGAADTGFAVPLDAAPDVGGQNSGFRPLELMLVSLAGCTAMDVVSILKKMRQDVSGFEVQVHGDRATDHPKVFTHIRIEYIFHGRGIDRAAVEKAIDLSATRYCSAQAMLAKATPIEHTFTIHEVDGSLS